MNELPRDLARPARSKPVRIAPSACPHDCPSTCALEVEVLDSHTIGRVRGAAEQSYTAGVICAKVARYAERVHHPDRLLRPLRRKGEKGSGEFAPISWDDALDLVAERLERAAQRDGAQAVWPYYYAGTMGLVMRDGINRLRHAKAYSGFHQTICVNPAYTGFAAGTGRIAGPDPREMAKSDLVVIWGTNAVNTQVNVMTHAIRARKERGAKIVAVDVYMNETMQQADLAVLVRPGTDGALACAVMHCLFRDGRQDRDFLARWSDAPDELEAHLRSRSPQWAAAITGCDVATIEAFARLVGATKRAYFRLGYGFARSRNGATNMHAASCIPTVTGAWAHEGGGAFHNNADIYHWNKTMTEGLDVRDPSVRMLDQSRIGAILCGDADALAGGPPVTALFIQNTNPMTVAPDQTRVKRGFARDDLFVCVHEQFMTETANVADVVLPATMFLEHDDFYTASGHTFFQVTKAVVEAPGECRENHYVISELAKRLGANHRGFDMTVWEIMDEVLKVSGMWDAETNWRKGGQDFHLGFETSHFLDGFAWPDKKFRFKPDWAAYGSRGKEMPSLPDHFDVIDNATDDRPFRMVAAPARTFLNSTFTETPSSLKREVRPTALMNPDDCAGLGVGEGDRLEIGNDRGQTIVHCRPKAGQQKGVVVVEGIWPNRNFETGIGINALTSADPGWPHGGAVFHDTAVWIRKA